MEDNNSDNEQMGIRRSPFFKYILVCTGFNLLLETWVHGFLGILNLVLIIFLSLMYMTFFFILGNLINRFHLKPFQILLFGFIFGMYQETFNTGSIFNDESSGLVFGINWLLLVIINIFMWGVLQSILANYLAFSKLGVVKSLNKKYKRIGWMLTVIFYVFMIFVTFIENNFPEGSSEGYWTAIILLLSAIIIFIFSIRKNRFNLQSKPEYIENPINGQYFYTKNEFLPFKKIIFLTIVFSVIGGLISTIFGNIGEILFVLWSVMIGIYVLIILAKN